MKTVDIRGLTAEESFNKIRDVLLEDPTGVVVAYEDFDSVRKVAPMLGRMGYRYEPFSTEGVNLVSFLRITTFG